MTISLRVFLLDADVQSRAAITFLLSGDDIHVEPYEDIADVNLDRMPSGVILVRDDDDMLARLQGRLEHADNLHPVVVFSHEPSIGRAVRAVRAGACNYIPLPAERSTIAGMLRDAQAEAQAMSAVHERSVAARQCVKRLTDREREVLTAVAHGLSNRSIAEQLGISPRTVEIHRANMLTKMGANTSPEAVRLALYSGMWS